ncbi:MAG: family 43 glycosylhydrolase [Lacisediminihabitans sp.]
MRQERDTNTAHILASDEVAGSETNPAADAQRTGSPIQGFYADPDLTVFDSQYFLYPTTDGFEEWVGTTFRVFTSGDLVDWQDRGVILDLSTDVSWASGQAWAPAISRRDGKYYFYFTAESNIGVAVSDSPTGPFVDSGRPLVADGDFSGRAIDPSIFRDDDGTFYLIWGNGDAHLVPLEADMVSFAPENVVTWTPTDFREAAWVHKRNGIYYLSWSVNDTRDANYRVLYATSTSLHGPWIDHGVLLEKDEGRGIIATGHHSIVNIPGSDEWVIAYHRFGIPSGDGFHREVEFDRLHHTDDGLIEKVSPSLQSLRLPLS